MVIERCSHALWRGEHVPIADAHAELLAANQQMSEQGLRVLAFAVRDLDDRAMAAATSDPFAAVTGLLLVALVGIIDPLRTEAKQAVRVALDAGIDVRMITGDHTVTAARSPTSSSSAPGSSPARSCSGSPTRRCSTGCPSCTSSGASRRKTRSGSRVSCRSRARSSR